MIKTIEKFVLKKSIILFLIILISLIGLMIRLLTYPQVFEQGRIVFLETDPYYHMWRVFSFIDTFPKTFFFDRFINYPYGALIGWPPLFDQMIAIVSLILGFGKPGMHLVESVGALMPVALGIFSIITVYFVANEIFNERVALFSSLLTAVLPAHVQISFLGFTDHHIAEVLLSIAAYLFFIRSLNNSSFKQAIRPAMISGIIIGISLLTWQGAPIFAGILLSYAVIQFILDRRRNNSSNYLIFTGTVSFLTAILVNLIFYIWTPWQHSITPGILSYFQPIFLAICAIIIVLMGYLSYLMRCQKWYYYLLLTILLFTSIFFLLNAGAADLNHGILTNIGYLLRDAPVLKQITEAQPLFYTYDGTFLGWQFFTNPVWNAFTFSFYFAIIGLIWFLFIYMFRKDMDKGKLFFVVWTLIALVLTLSQRRFAYTLAINVAISSGFFVDEIVQKVRSFLSRQNFKKNIPSLIYAFFILFLVVPNIAMSYELSKYPPKPSDDWYDSLIWLKDNTPEIKNEQEYGIMTWWDYGNWILYIAKRPVVSNNFQIGGDEAARFYVEQNETLANAIMDRRNARYVIMDYRMGLNMFKQGDQLFLQGAFFAVSSFADKNISLYLDQNNLPNQNYSETMYARMHVFDGNGLKNYRMIYESQETHYDLFGKPTKNIKIFEYVKGAKITGKASHGKEVQISGKIITNQGRIFDYLQEGRTDQKGYFELTVPYSKESPYGTRLLKNYELRISNTTLSMDVTENDVINGNTINVS
jgi:oligosaccharyl transferase (archaeosortase A-associated)